MHPEDFRFLDLNLLRVFDTVMSEGSLTRAADKLSLTQPAEKHKRTPLNVENIPD